MTNIINIGDLVSGGETDEDRDYGTVQKISDGDAWVAWQSGTSTWAPLGDLSVTFRREPEPAFTPDNTEGYDQLQLDALNHLYEQRIAAEPFPFDHHPEHIQKSILDHIAERVQADFDTETNLTQIDMTEIDYYLDADLTVHDRASCELYRAPFAASTVSNQHFQIVFCRDFGRAGIAFVGSGSNGETDWTDAASPEEAMIRYLGDSMRK